MDDAGNFSKVIAEIGNRSDLRHSTHLLGHYHKFIMIMICLQARNLERCRLCEIKLFYAGGKTFDGD